ncbi:unnamed protein product [Gongylonema pulchrum]|uniref:ENTH domain-containing protein n=1 Tax=Gongylonema pulchrum TaxID=637853 RepID=A0A183EAJ8_9BILA|nr:unnamed protein product [Gongylonema pulchrum]
MTVFFEPCQKLTKVPPHSNQNFLFRSKKIRFVLFENHVFFFQSLTLLHYLLKNGSERVINNARDHLFEMRALESYKYIDEKGKDQGLNVRHRAHLLIELIQDDDQLKAERKKAKSENKEKYQGFSKDDIRLGFNEQNSFGSFFFFLEKSLL